MGTHLIARVRRYGRRVCAASMVLLASCRAPAINPAAPTPVHPAAEATTIAGTAEYQRAGFLVGDGAVPFVGTIRYFGTEFVDTTLVFVALSIPPKALSFVRAGDRYAGYYSVKLDVMAGQSLIRSERPAGEVRVASFQETTRGDEGVIFQRAIRIAPGSYTLRVTAQDSLSAGTGAAMGSMSVPLMTNGTVTPPFPVFAAEPRTSRAASLVVVANPRATARYGRDSSIALYFEAYGPEAPNTIILTTTPDGEPDVIRRVDTIAVPSTTDPRIARVMIPIARLGLGAIRMAATRTNGTPIGSTVAMVSLGEDAPVHTVDELLGALRYFARDADLRVLRDATPEKRPALWAALMRHSDPNPTTPQNESLHEYFRRLRAANEQYREDARPGWETDRGAVVAALGEPDIVSEPSVSDSTNTSRFVTWEYKRWRLVLVFFDQSGLGRWKLTPASDAELRSLLSISGPCAGCH